MVVYAVLGLGLMGKALCYDLLTHDASATVIGFDLFEKQRLETKNRFENFSDRFLVKPLNLEVTSIPEQDELIQIIQKHSIKVIFGAIDYKFNAYITRICINAGVHFLDLGGNPDIVEEQKSLSPAAQKAGITVIPDCGLAPGMADIIAAHIMNQFDSPNECHIRVGGLPQKPGTILKYSQFFSIRGLTNEYLEDAIVIREGIINKITSLTELESLTFPEPWGQLEAFQTSGGTSSLPDLYAGKIQELTYKTIRFPGHCQFFQFLKEFELLSSEPFPNHPAINSREVVEYYLQKHLPQNAPDAVLIRISVSGLKNDVLQEIQYQLIDLRDEKTGYSAMARTTAFPISIIGQMIAHNVITERGVVPGETAVPTELFIYELAKRNIIFDVNEIK